MCRPPHDFEKLEQLNLPGGATFNFNVRRREVSRRTGSGAAREALGLDGPTERMKVEKLGDQGFETGSFAFLLPRACERTAWRACQRGGKLFTQCCPELQRVAITRIPPHGLKGQWLSLEGMSGSGLQQASAGCGLQLHDTSDATCQRSSVWTPETPKERVP